MIYKDASVGVMLTLLYSRELQKMHSTWMQITLTESSWIYARYFRLASRKAVVNHKKLKFKHLQVLQTAQTHCGSRCGIANTVGLHLGCVKGMVTRSGRDCL